MAKNPDLITVKADNPDPDVDNVEVTFPNTSENWEFFTNYLGKCKIEGLELRTLTPRNRYGAAGMPVEKKVEKLMADLAALGIDPAKLQALQNA